jgi:aryl-phospho-beta-D-glucosidase BglC (GH1 family)
MARVGLRHVRLCVAPAVILDAQEGRPREEVWPYLAQAIRRFHRAGLAVVVDIHNEDRQVELDPAWQEAFVRFWGLLAGRLSEFDPDRTLLELINEPVFEGREGEWDRLNARLAAAIRQAAPEHTMVTSGPNWGGIRGLRRLKLLEDPNVVYSFHFYEPFPFTHQGATWSSEEVKPLREVPYPSSPEAVASMLEGLSEHPRSRAMLERYGAQRWNGERLAAEFQQAVDWGRTHGVPLYCGEFGVFPRYARPEHRANWFRDVGEILARHKVGWAVWGWDEGFGLARRFVEGRPVVDEVVARALGLSAC